MKIWTSLRDNCSYHNNYWSSKKMFSELICQKLPLKFYVILFSKILITTRLIKRNFIYLPLAEPGKSQVSFQSQRRAMPKNAQTTPHLSSFHMLASWCSKCFKLGFNSTWTENFQMYNLDLEKAEEPEIKLSAPIGSYKNTREFQKKKNYFCFIDFTKTFDDVHHNKLWKILKEMGIPDHLTCLLKNL